MTRTIKLALPAVLLIGGVALAAPGGNGPHPLYLSLALVASIGGIGRHRRTGAGSATLTAALG